MESLLSSRSMYIFQIFKKYLIKDYANDIQQYIHIVLGIVSSRSVVPKLFQFILPLYQDFSMATNVRKHLPIAFILVRLDISCSVCPLSLLQHPEALCYTLWNTNLIHLQLPLLILKQALTSVYRIHV